jgi:hypothetical protein
MNDRGQGQKNNYGDIHWTEGVWGSEVQIWTFPDYFFKNLITVTQKSIPSLNLPTQKKQNI